MRETIAIIAFALAIFLSATDIFAAQKPEDYHPEGFTAECPYGDAVIVGREDSKVYEEVDCVTYDPSKNLWVTWFTNLKGEKLYQEWSPKDYRVFNMDGELIPVHGKKEMKFIKSYDEQGIATDDGIRPYHTKD